jgi:NADPH:quinone reductase-like Zn-dependent oxidoreductase
VHAGVGTIVKSASGKFKEGQRVVSAGKWNGTWQEYALADESSLVRSSALSVI